MNLIDIIIKKRDKQALTKEEIQFWIDGVSDKTIPDYQSSALLMAILLNGMNSEEITNLTLAMMHSGDVIDLSDISGITVDKHSTGGVGDKTSLVISPLVAACGAKVAKMSGRGLGHTGGTLDKLESIEGFNIFLTNKQFVNQVNKVGCAIIGQSSQLVPADKALYALRDVTGTVQSIPLIASSIMSKKLAASTDTILLDVKVGDGAFMKTIDEATLLANTMIQIGKNLNRDVRAIISDMNQPLGRMIGNALEVKEAVYTLKNCGPKDFEELCLTAASIMLVQAKIAADYEQGYAMALETLRNGQAYQKFCEWIEAQQGNVHQIYELDTLPKSKHIYTLTANQTGFVHQIKTEALGHLAMLLGGGRQTKEDSINYGVGLEILVKCGDKISAKDEILKIHHDKKFNDDLIQMALDCFVVKPKEISESPLIKKVLD